MQSPPNESNSVKPANGKTAEPAVAVTKTASSKSPTGAPAPVARPQVKVATPAAGGNPAPLPPPPQKVLPTALAGNAGTPPPGGPGGDKATQGPLHSEGRKKKASRPYVIPPGAILPAGMQDTIDEIVTPCTEELVLGEADPLRKSVGGSFAFLTAMEIISQHKLASAMLDPDGDPQVVERLAVEHERILKAKQRAADFLLRDQAQHARLLATCGPLACAR